MHVGGFRHCSGLVVPGSLLSANFTRTLSDKPSHRELSCFLHDLPRVGVRDQPVHDTVRPRKNPDVIPLVAFIPKGHRGRHPEHRPRLAARETSVFTVVNGTNRREDFVGNDVTPEDEVVAQARHADLQIPTRLPKGGANDTNQQPDAFSPYRI